MQKEMFEDENLKIGLAKDCFQTPDEAVALIEPMLRPLGKEGNFLDPCCGKGNIVQYLQSRDLLCYGFDIQGASAYSPYLKEDFITLKKDFLQEYEIACIVTNPPYSCYGDFIRKCFELDVPFALIVPDSYADSMERLKTFHTYGGLDVVVPPRRIAFETPTGRKGKDSSPQFLAVWVTHRLDHSLLNTAVSRTITYVKEM